MTTQAIYADVLAMQAAVPRESMAASAAATLASPPNSAYNMATAMTEQDVTSRETSNGVPLKVKGSLKANEGSLQVGFGDYLDKTVGICTLRIVISRSQQDSPPNSYRHHTHAYSSLARGCLIPAVPGGWE